MTKLIVLFATLWLSSCTIIKHGEIKNIQSTPQNLDETSFLIKSYLEEKTGFTANAKPDYIVKFHTKENIETSGIASDAFTSNFKITLYVSFTLTEVSTGKTIYSGTISKSANYIANKQNLIAEYTIKKSTISSLANGIAQQIYDNIQSNAILKA